MKRRKGLGKYVSQLMLSSDWKEFDKALIDLVTHEVAVYLNMLRSFVKNWVVGNVYSGLVVTKNECRRVNCHFENLVAAGGSKRVHLLWLLEHDIQPLLTISR